VQSAEKAQELKKKKGFTTMIRNLINKE
jgi:hypothetical protein